MTIVAVVARRWRAPRTVVSWTRNGGTELWGGTAARARSGACLTGSDRGELEGEP